MNDDGRILTTLSLLGLVAATAARTGSRGIVRANRKAQTERLPYSTHQMFDHRIFQTRAPKSLMSPTERQELKHTLTNLVHEFMVTVQRDLETRGYRRTLTLDRVTSYDDNIEADVDMSRYPSEVDFGPSVFKFFEDHQIEVID